MGCHRVGDGKVRTQGGICSIDAAEVGMTVGRLLIVISGAYLLWVALA